MRHYEVQKRAARAEKFEGKEVLVAEERGVGVVELDPLEDKKENLKSPFFVVLVCAYPKGAVVRTQMPLEVARTTHMVSRG